MNGAREFSLSLHEVGVALRRPEELALRWKDRAQKPTLQPSVFAGLLTSAAVGLSAYGLTMNMTSWGSMLAGAWKAPLAAGIAWTVALPALYIINSALGSKLDASTTLLAALATVSFGALAMLASVPVNWFFSLALPFWEARLLVNLVIFSGVGICMVDVFMRVMKVLEPERSRLFALVWLGLVGVIGSELMLLVQLFKFE